MSRILGTLMILLSCGVILMHAVVPHYHHDGVAVGILCEEDFNCHCIHGLPGHKHSHHGHGERPVDMCKLEVLLSSIVVSDNNRILLESMQPQVLVNLMLATSLLQIAEPLPMVCGYEYGCWVKAPPPRDWVVAAFLRGPPPSVC